MTALFDAGDLQRLDRERELTEEAPRQLPAEDRSLIIENNNPVEEPIQDELIQNEPEENGFDVMLEGLLMALQRRL